jgi:nucleoid-associated protein YgaU
MQPTLSAALTSKIGSVLSAAAATAPDKVRLRPDLDEAPGDPAHDEPEGDDPFEDAPPEDAPPEDAPPVPARTHTVRSGEWLSTIAEQHYGDAMRYGKIFDANKDRIPGFTDPDRIEVGWELVIPEL